MVLVPRTRGNTRGNGSHQASAFTMQFAVDHLAHSVKTVALLMLIPAGSPPSPTRAPAAPLPRSLWWHRAQSPPPPPPPLPPPPLPPPPLTPHARRPAVAATATIHRHHHHQSHTRTRPSTPTHADDNYEALRCYTEGTDIIEELRSLRNSPWAVDLGREDGLPCNPRVVLHAGRYRVSLLPTM